MLERTVIIVFVRFAITSRFRSVVGFRKNITPKRREGKGRGDARMTL